MLANANPYSGALPINPFAREIAAVCDKHAVPHGAPGKLDGFLRALHRNKHLAMDFWSLVVRISEEETSGSVDPDWLLAVIVEGVTGWNVAKLVASNTPDTPHLNELASMLAGEDLEELAPEPRAVAYPLRENDSLAEPVASLTPNQNQRLVLQPEPAIAANLVPNLLPLDDDQPSAFRLAGYAEAASGTTLPHAAILALLVIMLAAAGLLLFLHHDPSEWSRLRASVHTDLNAATFSHESRAAAAPTTPSPGSSTPNPFAIYRMPAEWEPHAATWIAWPHNPEDWPGKFQPIPWVYAEIVRHLSRVEDVHILVNDLAAERRATPSSAAAERTSPASTSTTGPPTASGCATPAPSSSRIPPRRPRRHQLEVQRLGQVRQLAPRRPDPHHVAKLYNIPEIKPEIEIPTRKPHRIVLEGGSIDTNGAGVLLTTEECLLSEVQQRNPGLGTKSRPRSFEQAFHDYLGIDQTLWLHRGCAGDDTHGHVDDITRFVAEDTILTCVEPNTADENHLPLAENLDRLKAPPATSPASPSRSSKLPMPAPVVFEGQRLPASYANFYIANARPRPHLQRPQRPHRPQHHRRLLPHPRSHRHPRRRPRLGPRHPPLPDPAGTRVHSTRRCVPSPPPPQT
jgi:agmatine deiminase